jgi:hypothetical protein
MKRSKLFLAGTTCLLAIAGVAATKAHHDVSRNVYRTSGSPHFLCTVAVLTHCSNDVNATATCKVGLQTLYTKFNNAEPCHTGGGAKAKYNDL